MDLPPPACMDAEEYELWMTSALAMRQMWGSKASGSLDPCHDCLVPFALEMMGQGRCNGIPGVARKPRDANDKENIMARLRYFRVVLSDMGLDPAHAEAVG